jgi:KDO2-lipid IV(A) lauroyltransferase
MRPEIAALTPHPPPRWHAHAYNHVTFYRLAAGLGSCLPRRLRLALARQVGRLGPRLLPSEWAAVRHTLARVTGATGPDLDEQATAVFRNFAMCFSDLVSTNRQPAVRLTSHVGPVAGAECIVGIERGLISLTAHVGNWELAGRLLAGRAARPTRVVVAPEDAPGLERWVRRNGDGVRFESRSRPTVSVQLVAALRRGEVVAMQGDRALGSRGDVAVDFFGHPAPFPIGPFLLARAAHVPIVPAFCLLDADHRYTVTLREPLSVSPGREADGLRSWVALLEEVVRGHPTQWFNFFDVWNPWGGPAPLGASARPTSG